MTQETKNKVGVVTKKSGDKTVVVEIKRLVKHAVFEKYITRRKKFHVHDPANTAGVGDKVKIVECRPISKIKNWRLHSVVEKAK